MTSSPVVLSASSMATYLRCGHQWYLAYVVRLKSPPSIRQAIGLAAHSAVEHNMAQKIVSREDVPVEEMTDVFSDQFESFVPEIEDPEEPVGKAKDSGIGLVKLHRKEVSPLIQPIWVEKSGQFEINGVPYSWTVDLVDDKGRVRDTKTKKASPRPEEFLLQMTGYALGYRHETGLIETDTVIDALVRTQVPKYVPVYGGRISEPREKAFADTVQTIYEGIEGDVFAPNGLSNGACSWCGYANACAYRRR
jgi:CRISPR/Cas system-associated exonuclease Cas4 (RecB family)